MTENRTLDRIVEFDERSRNYPIRAVIETSVFRDRLWACNTWNDQGQEGACVGFGWSHELSSEPAVVPTTYTIAYNLYKRAQQLDQWAGENYEGTSVLAGAKAVSELVNASGQKYISEYRWAFGLADVLLALAHQGPVVLGLNWYRDMFNVDVNGFIRATGTLMGGHCLLAVGVEIISNVADPTTLAEIDLDASYVTLHNSWGRDWGNDGKCKITVRDLQKLLNESGDACVPMVRNVDSVILPTDPVAPTPEPVKPQPDNKSGGDYFSVRRSAVFHRGHPGIRPFKYFGTREAAIASGLRPCSICRP